MHPTAPAATQTLRLPSALLPALEFIERHPSGEAGVAMTQYVASFAHPDMVCNLAMMEALPADARESALAFFSYCLGTGLTIEEQGELLRFIQPWIVRTLGGHPPH